MGVRLFALTERVGCSRTRVILPGNIIQGQGGMISEESVTRVVEAAQARRIGEPGTEVWGRLGAEFAGFGFCWRFGIDG